jgi:hypothetical protein
VRGASFVPAWSRRWIGPTGSKIGRQPAISRSLVREIAYFYITRKKNARKRPLNPVAGFHLGNVVRLSFKNVHFGANRSERGLSDSASVMVSYVYSSTWRHELRRTARSVLPWET